MGCGCKSEDIIFYSGDTEDKKLNFDNKIRNFLFRKNKFSLIGIFLYIFLLPIITIFVLPIITIILFNRIVLGKQTDIIKLMAFVSNKKSKKIKK